MRNLWLMARHEYLRMVRQKRFLWTVLGFPLLLMVIMGIGIFFAINEEDVSEIGVVDQADVVDTAVPVPIEGEEDPITIREYPDEAAAREAWQAGEIQVFYILPAGYPGGEEPIRLYDGDEEIGGGTTSQFDNWLRANLTTELAEPVRNRVRQDPTLIIRSQDGERELSQGNVVQIFIPFIAAFIFFFAIMSASGYLLQVVADEKENRTIEILVTSMTPEQLIGGKALGLIAVSFTQLLIWAVALAILALIGAQFLEPLQQLTMPWGYILLVLAYFVPTFAILVGIMTALGGIATEMQQAQQIGGVLNFLFIIPLFLTALIISSPSSPLVQFLTLFPTTAFLTVALRQAMSSVPVWQLLVSWGLAATTAVLTVWGAARIFRAGMLRYGRRMSLRGVLAAIGLQHVAQGSETNA